MPAKKLEDQSKYDAYDMDDDGIVSKYTLTRKVKGPALSYLVISFIISY